MGAGPSPVLCPSAEGGEVAAIMRRMVRAHQRTHAHRRMCGKSGPEYDRGNLQFPGNVADDTERRVAQRDKERLMFRRFRRGDRFRRCVYGGDGRLPCRDDRQGAWWLDVERAEDDWHIEKALLGQVVDGRRRDRDAGSKTGTRHGGGEPAIGVAGLLPIAKRLARTERKPSDGWWRADIARPA